MTIDLRLRIVLLESVWGCGQPSGQPGLARMELTLGVEQHGSAEVAGNVRGALDTISSNEEFINLTLAVLMAPE